MPSSPAPLTRVVLYSRPGCHLCDEMKALVDHVRDTIPFDLTLVDISNDDALEERYGVEIPVLLVNGEQVARYRISESELKRVLTRDDRSRLPPR